MICQDCGYETIVVPIREALYVRLNHPNGEPIVWSGGELAYQRVDKPAICLKCGSERLRDAKK